MREQKTYGRRQGRRLRPSQMERLQTLLPQLSLTIHEGKIQGLSPLTNPYKGYFLEIGFGAGEHLILQAEKNPDILMIGCEPFINGVAHILKAVEEKSLTNLRLYPGNALDLLPFLPENSAEKIFLLFPDPWPKASHHKRRFVQTENLLLLSKVLKKEGLLLMATDHLAYLEWMIEKTSTHPFLRWENPSSETWHIPPPLWIPTRFQQKAEKAGRTSHFLWFRKV